MKRIMCVLATFGATLALAVPAYADSGSSDSDATSDSTPGVTDTSAASTETDTSSASTDTDVPSTETEVPSTQTEVPSTTVTDVPVTTTTDVPGETDTDIPVDVLGCTTADCIPTAGGITPTAVGAGALPFTGIRDVIAPMLLGLVVLIGGVVAWRWAAIREAMAAAAARKQGRPVVYRVSGYGSASRQIQIEDRARRMFAPRVA